MTEEFGPLDDDSSGGKLVDRVTDRLAGWWLTAVVALVPTSDTRSVTYDRTANRLSLHGESERSCSGHRAGWLSALLAVVTALASVVPFLLLGSLHTAAMGTVFSVPLLVALGVAAFPTIFTFHAIFERGQSMTVYDHTTEPKTEFDELDEQYLNGEIDTAQLEAEKEARLQ